MLLSNQYVKIRFNLISYFVVGVLIFSQNVIAYNGCKHSTDTTTASFSITENSNAAGQEESTSHCHTSSTEDNSEIKLANDSTCDFSCCDSGCLHCQVYSAHVYIEFKPGGFNFEQPVDKELRKFSELNYISHNSKPIIPPPIS